jgi:hypothetical protein
MISSTWLLLVSVKTGKNSFEPRRSRQFFRRNAGKLKSLVQILFKNNFIAIRSGLCRPVSSARRLG